MASGEIPGRFSVLLLGVLLTACNQTTYLRADGGPVVARAQTAGPVEQTGPGDHDMPDAGPVLPGGPRTVSYGLSKAYFRQAPRCILVLPMDRDRVGDAAARALEDAVARHLAHRVGRVVPAGRVGHERRRRALRPDDLKRLGRALRCDAAMQIKTPGFQRTFALVWAQARLGLTLQLRATRNGEALWWGRHAAERSEGGLPMGLLSLPIEAFSASRFAEDADVLPSMADDVARRVMESLPPVPQGRDRAGAGERTVYQRRDGA